MRVKIDFERIKREAYMQMYGEVVGRKKYRQNKIARRWSWLHRYAQLFTDTTD